MENHDFPQMVAALRAGDEAAVEALLRRYESYIRRFVRIRLHGTNLARLFDSMDICQSILASFFAHARAGDFQLGTPDQLRNLLVKMAVNKVLAKARMLQMEVGNLPEAWDAPDPAPTPLEQAASADLAQAALGLLRPEELSLFRLHEVEGQTWEEIARAQGCSPDALRIRLTRALARVRKQFAPEP